MNINKLKPTDEFLKSISPRDTDTYEEIKMVACQVAASNEENSFLKKDEDHLLNHLHKVGAITQSKTYRSTPVYLISNYYKDIDNLIPITSWVIHQGYFREYIAQVYVNKKDIEEYNVLFRDRVVCIDIWGLYVLILKPSVYEQFKERLLKLDIDPIEFMFKKDYKDIIDLYPKVMDKQKELFLTKDLTVEDINNLNEDSSNLLQLSSQFVLKAGYEFGFSSYVPIFKEALEKSLNTDTIDKLYNPIEEQQNIDTFKSVDF